MARLTERSLGDQVADSLNKVRTYDPASPGGGHAPVRRLADQRPFRGNGPGLVFPAHEIGVAFFNIYCGAEMNWVVLLGPSIAWVFILISVYLWQGTSKDERPVRLHIDDIPFR